MKYFKFISKWSEVKKVRSSVFDGGGVGDWSFWQRRSKPTTTVPPQVNFVLGVASVYVCCVANTTTSSSRVVISLSFKEALQCLHLTSRGCKLV